MENLILNRIVGALFIIPLAFDYKNQTTGGSVAQYILVSLVCVTFLYYFSINYKKNDSIFKDSMVWAIVVTLLSSILPFLLWDNLSERYLRVGLPYLLFLFGYIFSFMYVRNGNYGMLFGLMTVGGMISVVVNFINGYNVSGDIYNARYQILSPIILCCIVIFMHNILIKKELSAINILSVLSILAIIILSQTRSALGAFLLIVIVYILISGVNFLNALFFAIMGGTLIFIFMYLAPDYLTEGWIGRFSAINDFGFDLTSETRFAEMYGQYEMWMESYISILFGRGWGAQYYWSGDSFDLVRSVLGSDFYGDEQFEAGHNFWFYSIFASGILFGVFFPAMILARVWNIFLNMVYMVDRSYCNVDLVVFSAAGVISFLLMTVGGNPMGTRYSALIYGVIFALTSPIIKNSRIIERY